MARRTISAARTPRCGSGPSSARTGHRSGHFKSGSPGRRCADVHFRVEDARRSKGLTEVQHILQWQEPPTRIAVSFSFAEQVRSLTARGSTRFFDADNNPLTPSRQSRRSQRSTAPPRRWTTTRRPEHEGRTPGTHVHRRAVERPRVHQLIAALNKALDDLDNHGVVMKGKPDLRVVPSD
jgi:hypothetical protein